MKWCKVFAQVMIGCIIVACFSSVSISSVVQAEDRSSFQVNQQDIPEHTLRVHYQNKSGNYSDLGLWVWGDVATPSEAVASWPKGATPFESKLTDFGAYADIPLKADANKVNFLMVNRETGVKEGHEISVVLISPELNEVWIKEDSSEAFLWEPVILPENTVRIHLLRSDQHYEDWGLWLWGDVITASEAVGSWPTGATPFSNERTDRNGSYIDVQYKNNAQMINFIVVNRGDGTKDGGDRAFTMLKDHNHIFLKEGNPGVFTSPYISNVEESSAYFPEWSKDSTIYEVNVRQYTKEGTFKAFQEHLPRLKELGVEILWFMPIFPISEEKRLGSLGSYYAPASFTDVNPEFGTLNDFKQLVDKAHELGFKIVLDWVANHTGWDHEWIEHIDWYVQDESGNIVSPNGWSDVAELNFNNADMRKAMIDAMKFWVEKYDIDGYRADHAAGVPQDFWEAAREELDAIKPVYMLAEDESQYQFLKKAFNANYGWDLFYNVMLGIVKREKGAGDIKSYIERNKMLYPIGSYPMYFTTNHDINSWEGTTREMLGDAEQALAALTFTLPGIPLIYSGQEVGLDKRLEFFEKDEIDWSGQRAQEMTKFYKTLTDMKKNNEALWNGSFGGELQFLEVEDERVLAFEREKDGNKVITIMNLSGEAIETKLNLNTSAGSYYAYFANQTVKLDEVYTISLAPWSYYIYSNKQPVVTEPPTKPTAPPSNTVADPASAPISDTYVVEAEELRKLEDTQSIIVPAYQTKLALPINSAELLGDRTLTVQFQGVAVTVNSAVLQEARDKGTDDSKIVLQVNKASEQAAAQALQRHQSEGTNIRYISGLYDFSLLVMSGTDIIAVLNTITEPITLSFDLTGTFNAKLTAMFNIDSQSQLRYIGGTIQNHQLIVNINELSSYSVLELDKNFADVTQEDEALLAIKVLAARGIVHGITSNLFAPIKEIKRAELTVMLVRALGLEVGQGSNSFNDVNETAWYAAYIEAAYQNGIVKGNINQSFDPNKPVTAEEMALMLIRAYQLLYGDNSIAALNDDAAVSTYADTSLWAIEQVKLANALQLLGDNIENIEAKSFVTRADAVQSIYRLLTIQ